MKKELKKILKSGLFIMIGVHEVDFPIDIKWESLSDVFTDLGSILNIFVTLSSVFAVAMIIVSGYTLITSAGNPEKIEQGQKSLTAAVVGLVIVWAMWIIIKFVLDVVGY